MEIQGKNEEIQLNAQVQARLKALPRRPGVYLMKDARGQVIYVGKAADLRARVRSYFHRSNQHHPRTQRLVNNVADIEWISVGSGVEALVLENQLIKQYQPRYNIRLKDDKTYPYIKIHWQDPFPKVTITRRMEQDGARYYGPYTSAWAVRQTLEALRRVFPYLTCNRQITGEDTRACLYYDIQRCAGPCIGAVDQAEYRDIVAGLAQFLEGETETVIADLESKMRAAAENLQFERAALLRDQMLAAQRIASHQQVVAQGTANQDVLALAHEGDTSCVQVFFIRRGKLLGRETFFLEGTDQAEMKEVLTSFIQQFYDEAAQIPPEVIVPISLDEAPLVQQWLAHKSGHAVALRLPGDGREQALVEMATTNAAETLQAMQQQWAETQLRQEQALGELQRVLNLPSPPARIEGFDISTLQGRHTVGAMVVFVQGVPRKSDYRRFNVKTVDTVLEPDDFAAMREVLRRRLRRLVEKSDEGGIGVPDPGEKARRRDQAWRIMPDLMLIDGGKGQLNVALEVLDELGLRDAIPVVALAKKEEALFLPGQGEPLVLPRDSEALKLLQRVRDEAHRFSVTAHRQRRRRNTLQSVLEEVPGIGPRRRQALLRQFDSLDAIRQASVEDLARVPGMNRRVAQALKEALA